MSSAKHIYHDVEGSPLRIGQRVLVVKGTDETFSQEYVGKTGTVVYFEYSCGCGQTYPNDPMIGLRFADGTIEEFWREEVCSSSVNAQQFSQVR